VNSNAFEFKLNLKDARFNDAAKFGDDLSELNKSSPIRTLTPVIIKTMRG